MIIIIMNNFNDLLIRTDRKESLQIIFHQAKVYQHEHLRTIDNKCALMEDSLSYLQKIVSRLEQKIHDQAEIRGSQKMADLRDKQKQFIISQLQNKIKRIEESQQTVQALILEKQSKCYDLQYKNQQLRAENTELKQELTKKTKQIKQLIKTNSSLKLIKTASTSISKPEPTLNLSELGCKKQKMQIQSENYEEIESKLKEMQDCLNDQIEQYKRKNAKLLEEIEKLKGEVKKEEGNGRKILELEIRIKNLNNDNKQLSQSFTAQVAQNNENEIKFHKKINEARTQIQDLKKINKNISKEIEKELRNLSSIVLGANDKPSIFIGATTFSEQVSELAKQILKCHKKQLNSVILEKDSLIEELKVNLQSSKNKIKQLNSTVQKIRSTKVEKIDKSPILSSYSVSSKNNSKTDLDAKEKQNTERIEKHEQKVQELRNSLDERQKQINDMRRKHDEQQTGLSRKILELQAKLAQNQMDLKYQHQKSQQIVQNYSQNEKRIRNESQREIEKLKDKIKQSQTQKEQLRAKNREAEEKIYAKEKQLRQWQKKQKEYVEKAKKMQKKYETKQIQYKSLNESKEKAVLQLIQKNQSLIMENKLLKQKAKLIQSKLNSLKEQSLDQINSYQATVGSAKELQNQFKIEKELLETQIQRKDKEIEQWKKQLEERILLVASKQEKINDLTAMFNKNENENRLLKNQNEILKQSLEKLKESNEKANNISQLKQEYEKRQKLLKIEGQKLIGDLKNSLKESQAEIKKLSQQKAILKSQNTKFKETFSQFEQSKLKFQSQKFKDSERQLKLTKQYQNKIKALEQKVHQLEKSVHVNEQAKQKAKINLIKGTDSVQYVQYGIATDRIQTNQIGVNTIDIFALQTRNQGEMDRILDFNDEEAKNNNEQALRNSNLFMNLNQNPPADDVFEICDEGEEVNFGQSSLHLHVRQLFSSLRLEIQKLFNQQEISFGITKILPPALQDDYYQLMSYIKQKIAQIKVSNQISFIMAETGNEPEPPLDQSLQFPQLNRHGSEQTQSLKKMVEQQQALIHSLMNERTEQQNTINQLTLQKQQIQEQNQNKFMNQCNIYKKQIKQHKKNIDILEMNFQSMKNVIRNVLQAFSQDEDMEDDFRDSMTLYARVANLTEKERSRINYYIQKYLQIKGLNGGD